MAIKKKGTYSNDIKSVEWFASEAVGLAYHRLTYECLDSGVMVSAAKTRKGDVAVSLVHSKDEVDKYYFDNADDFIDFVDEVAGGDIQEEPIVAVGEARKRAKPTNTKG